MECVRCASAVCCRIGQWLDDLELFDYRAGPAVRDDDRERVLVLRASMNEVDVQAVDLGDEAREGVEPRFALAPVVLVCPIACELLDRRERHSLRHVRDRFFLRQPRGLDAPAQFGQFRFRNIHMKRTNSGLITARLLCNLTHSFSRLRSTGFFIFYPPNRINNDDGTLKTMLSGDVLISSRTSPDLGFVNLRASADSFSQADGRNPRRKLVVDDAYNDRNDCTAHNCGLEWMYCWFKGN